MELIIVTKKNLELAIQIQNRIFVNQNRYDDGTIDFLKGLSGKPDKEFNFVEHYLAKDGDTVVGCSGLYSYYDNPKEAWLSWFGVLPEARKKGYGEQILAATKELAKQKGFTTLRLYTSGKLYANACKLYEKTGFTGENYTKELPLNIMGLKERIYSVSLTDKPVTPWNNKHLHIFRHELFDSILLTDKKKQRLKNEILQNEDNLSR
jgi:GNAT superfamily N-acetyltransferase